MTDPDRYGSALFYCLCAAVSFGLWRDSVPAGIFVFSALWPINLGMR